MTTNVRVATNVQEVEEMARRMRINIIRMIGRAGSGHPGGSLSCVDIIATLFFLTMDRSRDVFVLSKGHAVPALYAVLHEVGILTEDGLKTLRQFGSPLQGHPSSLWLPDVGFSSGMLGQGLSFANGKALRARIEGNPRLHFVLLGEGDLQNGQTWSAAQTASHHRLGKLIAVCDLNGFQIGGRIQDIKGLEPLAKKWTSFGWLTFGVDGHDIGALRDVFNTAVQESGEKNLPSVILARTTKGKGVSFMEGNNRYHGNAPTRREAEMALQELGGEPWQN